MSELATQPVTRPDYAEAAYVYAQAHGLTAAQVANATVAQFATVCDVVKPYPERFRQMGRIWRRRIAQRLRADEVAARGETQRAAIEAAIQAVAPNAVVTFIQGRYEERIDGPAFLVRRAE